LYELAIFLLSTAIPATPAISPSAKVTLILPVFYSDMLSRIITVDDMEIYQKVDLAMSNIFNEAYAKGTSVYPANFVFPMLPEDLSNGICSLNPNVDRLTKTCKIVYDSEGNVLDYSIFDSVINSNYRMTYSKVNDILEKNIVDDQYLPYIDLLYKMNDLSNILQKNKISRGSMCFETPELQFVLSEEGKIQEIYDKSRGPSELMIENFMLATNEIIASFAYHLQVPFAYRNHEGPTVEQISKLKNILYTCKRYFNSIKNADHPKRLHKILLNISKTENSGIMRYFSKQILSCMNRAYYGTENIGHYALALDNYATFTSPIRRFPDLLNHMIIGKILNGEINNLDIETDEFKTMCEHCSEMQLISDSFERNIDSLLLHNYISEFSDKVLQGEIIFITDEFVCIKTQESIYGNILIKKKMLKDGYVNLEGDFYKVGDTICVRIGDINPKNSEVTFIYHKQNLKTKKKGSK